MSIEQHQSDDPISSWYTQPEPATAPASSAATEFHLSELEGLLRGLVSAPPEQMDNAVVATVRKATKARSRLSVLLALRALRLEQGLRQAQRQVIQLQWELAQFRRYIAPLPASHREVED